MRFPNTAGSYYSFSDLSMRVSPGAVGVASSLAALPFVGVKSLKYNDNLTRTYVRGASIVALGVTQGRYEAKGEVELYLDAASFLFTVPGWRQIPFQFTNVYSNLAMTNPLITDAFTAFVTDLNADQQESDDPLTRKFGLMIVGQINWNGVPSIVEFAQLLAVA